MAFHDHNTGWQHFFRGLFLPRGREGPSFVRAQQNVDVNWGSPFPNYLKTQKNWHKVFWERTSSPRLRAGNSKCLEDMILDGAAHAFEVFMGGLLLSQMWRCQEWPLLGSVPGEYLTCMAGQLPYGSKHASAFHLATTAPKITVDWVYVTIFGQASFVTFSLSISSSTCNLCPPKSLITIMYHIALSSWWCSKISSM